MSPQKNSGVTMPELLVSLNIICFAIFVMAVVVLMLIRSGQKNIDNSSAYIVADSVMKVYLADNKGILKNEVVNGVENYGHKKYKYQIETSRSDVYQAMFYVKVSVTSVDADGAGTAVNAVISTIVSERAGL